MNKAKLEQLIKEALSNMIDEDDTLPQKEALEKAVNYYNQNAGSVSMKDAAKKFNVSEFDVIKALNQGAINFQEGQELDEIDATDLGDKNFNTAIANEYSYDDSESLEEMDIAKSTIENDAENLANFLLSLPNDIDDTNFEDEFPLREFFGMNEMARVSDTYEGSNELIRLLQLMNTNIQGPKGRGRKRAPFTPEDLKSIINVVKQGNFTALDISNAIMNTDSNLGQIRQVKIKDLYNLAVEKGLLPPNWDKDTINSIKINNPTKYQEIQDLRKDLPGTPQWVNAKLNHIEKGLLSKNYITRTSELKKSMEPTVSAEPKRRGRPPAPRPEDEFDVPEMEPEMAGEDDPVVQQATQAQAQGSKRQQVQALIDKAVEMGYADRTDTGIIIRDRAGYDELKSQMLETLNENEDTKHYELFIWDPKKEGEEMPTSRLKRIASLRSDKKGEPFTSKKAAEEYFDNSKYNNGKYNFKIEEYEPGPKEINESKNSNKGLLQERFQTLAGLRPLYALNEALNKDLKSFGGDLKKFMEEKGLKVELKQGNSQPLYDPIGKNADFAALNLQDDDLHVIVNDSKINVLEDIIKKYNLKTLKSIKQTGGWADDPKKKTQNKGEIILAQELKSGRKGKAFELVIRRFDPSTIM